MPRPEEIAAEAHRLLAAAVDPVFGEGQRNFFKHEVNTWGVRSEALRGIAKNLAPLVKPLPAAQRNRFCALLWKSGKLEEGILAVYVYDRFAKRCGVAEFDLFEKWIDRYVENWATCDAVCTRLVRASIENEPSLIARLPAWTASKNRWKRRAAAVSLVWEGRRGRHTAEIFGIADRLLGDEDDMVRKGVGWMLKDAFPSKPKELTSYWEKNAARVPALVLRLASEKMPGPLAERLRKLRIGV